MLRDILSSPTWFNYERGQLAEEECHQQIGEEFNIFSEEVRRAFDQARESLVADDALIDLIRDLKTESDGRLRIFAMSNISPPDWAVLRTKPADLAFTSTSSRAQELTPVRLFLLTTNWKM